MIEKLTHDNISDLCAWLLVADQPAITVQKDFDGNLYVIFFDAEQGTNRTIYWSFKDV